MTIATLIERLQSLAQEHGDELLVLAVDGEGEWPFGLHVEVEALGDPPAKVLYLDLTSPDE